MRVDMKNIPFITITCAIISGCTTFSGPSAPTDSLLGYNAFKSADYPSAERFLASALAANPNDPYANLSMGSIMHQTKRPDQARKFYQVAIANGEQTFPTRLYRTGADAETAITAAGSTSRSIADLARQNLALS